MQKKMMADLQEQRKKEEDEREAQRAAEREKVVEEERARSAKLAEEISELKKRVWTTKNVHFSNTHANLEIHGTRQMRSSKSVASQSTYPPGFVFSF